MSPRCPMQDEDLFWEQTEKAKNPSPDDPKLLDMSRRSFMQTAAAAGGATLLSAPQIALAQQQLESNEGRPRKIQIKLTVNDKPYSLALDSRTSLLDTLRDQLGLTGSKKGCDHGQCGACTVLVNGKRINSCLSLGVSHEKDEIRTIEGLADGGNLHPVQASFLDHDGYQCGYCTPGQICSAVALIDEAKAGDLSFASQSLAPGEVALTKDEIRERMSGNICRCGAYPNIVAAVEWAARKQA
ncbi:MAG TPA: 2Fe-2S iron-sulfur cluster-binding protein [Terriglobales bacterium]|nr:2Fe-2S iron-sulfur cluster-binding protein [Terriglobales bacterium]